MTKTYTATFNAPHVYAREAIEAATPEEALKKAHALYAVDPGALFWDSYAGNARPLESIQIECDDSREEANWQSDAVTVRLAAPQLLDALETLVERDRAEAAESGFTDDEMSWLEDARRVIAMAKGGAA